MKKILLLLFIILLLSACNTKQKQEANGNTTDYPDETINMIVPVSAGGSGDIMTRLVAKIGEEDFGQTIVVENKAGGSGSVGLNELLKNEADGYTIFYQSSTLPLTMASGTTPFTPEDIQPVASMVSNYQVLAVPADSPFETYQDLVDYAKENPGEVDVVSAQTNGTSHVFTLKIMEGSDIDLNYIAYDSGGEALTRILGGNGDVISSSGEVVQQQVESGELRLLGVSSSERAPQHPDVPTFKELGLEKIDDELIWRAYFVKAGTPPEIVEKIAGILKGITEDEEFIEYAEKTNQDIYFKTGEEFEDIFNNYYEDGKELLSN